MEQYAYRIESRLISEPDFPYAEQTIRSPQSVFEFVKVLQDSDIEKMIVIFLSQANHVNCIQITPGTLNNAIVYPREIIKAALLSGSAALIIVHNHPFTSTFPSHDDIKITNRLKEACKLVEINLLDHMVVNKEDFYSFQEHGLI